MKCRALFQMLGMLQRAEPLPSLSLPFRKTDAGDAGQERSLSGEGARLCSRERVTSKKQTWSSHNSKEAKTGCSCWGAGVAVLNCFWLLDEVGSQVLHGLEGRKGPGMEEEM